MANNFAGDSRCKALWHFNVDLTSDAIGTNTLSQKNTPVRDTSTPLEGTGSVQLLYASDNGLYCTDANLQAGFPLKSGDAVKKATFACRFKPTAHANAPVLLGKLGMAGGSNNQTFLLVYNNTGKLSFGWATSLNSLDWSFADFTSTLTDGHTYHIAVVIDGVAKTLKVYLYDMNTGQKWLYTKTYASELYIDTGEWLIGCGRWTTGGFTGDIDEVVVFNSCLALYEIDAIRRQAFTANMGYPLLTSAHNDSFTGANNSAPNASLWDVTLSQNGGNVDIQSNQLRLATPGGADDAFQITTQNVSRDLNVQIDYSLTTHPNTDFWTAGMWLFFPDGKYFTVERHYRSQYGSNYYICWYYDGSTWNQVGGASTTDTSGKLRITKIGNVCHGYYWSGTAWVELGTGATTTYDYVQVAIRVESLSSHPAVDVRFDNFAAAFYGPPDPARSASICQGAPAVPPANAISLTICHETPCVPPQNSVSLTTAGVALPTVDPAVSHTICQETPAVPPEHCISATICEETPAVPPYGSISLTTCENIPPAPSSAVSLTIVASLIIPPPDKCISLTRCKIPASGGPHDTVSKTICQDIPMAYGEGLFTVF